MYYGFAMGALVALTVIAMLVTYGFLGTLAIQALWSVRRTNLFVWAVFNTYFAQKGWVSRSGHLSSLTRQARRRIERLKVRLGLL